MNQVTATENRKAASSASCGPETEGWNKLALPARFPPPPAGANRSVEDAQQQDTCAGEPRDGVRSVEAQRIQPPVPAFFLVDEDRVRAGRAKDGRPLRRALERQLGAVVQARAVG